MVAVELEADEGELLALLLLAPVALLPVALMAAPDAAAAGDGAGAVVVALVPPTLAAADCFRANI